jgi:hypothetical protein
MVHRLLSSDGERRGKNSAMNFEISELTRRGAIDAVDAWRQLGCEYASILDGVPRPWDPKPLARISADAALRGIEVLSLANAAHVESILEAICRYIERSLSASQAQAETRKLGALLTRGGSA